MKPKRFAFAQDSRYAAIAKRWEDKNPNDIDLFGEMPNWRTVVEDIHTLLELPTDLDEAMQEGYNKGYVDGFTDGEERAWEEAYITAKKDFEGK